MVVDENENEVVDLNFGVRGDAVPYDHGYALYAALCHEIPELHGAAWLRVHPIRGQQLVSGAIRLRDHSTVSLRLPLARLGVVLGLSGRTIDIRGERVLLRTPTIAKLEPSPGLDARTVVVKLTKVPLRSDQHIDKPAFEQAFLAELQRQLNVLPASADIALTGRQQIEVGGRRVLGYSVRLLGLKAEDSIRIQRDGLGGKRRMGCGVFVPTRGRR
jgi:CRISPR-associated protein Cas6